MGGCFKVFFRKTGRGFWEEIPLAKTLVESSYSCFFRSVYKFVRVFYHAVKSKYSNALLSVFFPTSG